MGSGLHLGNNLEHCLRGRVTLNGMMAGRHLFIIPAVLAVIAFIPVHFLFDFCPAPVLPSVSADGTSDELSCHF